MTEKDINNFYIRWLCSEDFDLMVATIGLDSPLECIEWFITTLGEEMEKGA